MDGWLFIKWVEMQELRLMERIGADLWIKMLFFCCLHHELLELNTSMETVHRHRAIFTFRNEM